jgi:flavin-dependent dehydrogenase
MYDVVVVGAGLAGLTCAKQLYDRGLSVCVLEEGARVGGRGKMVCAHRLASRPRHEPKTLNQSGVA